MSRNSEEEFAYGMLIKALTGGLYPNKFHIIREYVQNSYDAIKEWKENNPKDNCYIKVGLDSKTITIYDNATGMTKEKLTQYRYLGFSKKRLGAFAGYRGIGSAAAIAIVEELVIRTSPYGLDEKYILTIQAGEMLKRIDDERRLNETSSLKELMRQYTRIAAEPESKDKHYTIVELRGVNNEAKDLLDSNQLIVYLSANVPVPFHPDFRSPDGERNYGIEIEEKLISHVRDYYPVKLFVGNEQVYKMYRARWGEHNRQIVTLSEPSFMSTFDNRGKMIAYSWYCSNTKKGQIDIPVLYNGNAIDLSGLVFKLKGFAIGDKQYVRDNVWQNADHVAYYFVGEVHICDDSVEPTSERSGLVDNPSRTVLFAECWNYLGRYLVKKAYTQSSKLRATEIVNQSLDEIKTIEKETEKGIVGDVVLAKQMKIHDIIRSVNDKVRKKGVTDNTKLRAGEVLERSKKLLTILSVEENNKESQPRVKNAPRTAIHRNVIVVDITEELGFDKQSEQIYRITIKALKEFFAAEPEDYERAVNMIVERLRKEFR